MSIRDALWSGKGPQHPRVIDAHAHAGRWQSFYIPQLTTEQMLNEMDRHGIDVCCVSSLMAIAVDTRRGNDEVSALIRRAPDRFLGYVSLNPHQPLDENRRELDRRLSESSNFIGVKFHPMWHGYPLDGDLYRPLWDLAAGSRPLVLGHSWLGGEEPESHNTPERFARMAAEYPDVTIIMGHGGGTHTGHREAAKYCSRYDNLYMDICAGEFSCLWMEDLLALAPVHKILFGTDMPFLGPGSPIGRIEYSDIDDMAKRSILGDNMDRILKKTTNWKGDVQR